MILIAGTVAILNVKRFWSYISDFLLYKSPYATISTVISYTPKLQQEDLMARTVQKKLATSNVNIYFGQLGKPWSEVKGVLHYDGKLYILETLQADLLKRNQDDPLARHFGIKKTLEILIRKYYWPKMGSDVMIFT